MTLKDEIVKRPRWAIVGATGLAGVAGLTGFAWASGGSDDGGLPGPITLQETVSVTRTAEALPTQDAPYEVPAPIVSPNDSPFDSVSSPDTAAPAPGGAAGAGDSFDSPDYVAPPPSEPAAPPPAPATVSYDSPDTFQAPQAPAPEQSFDSPDTSPASFDSPDNS